MVEWVHESTEAFKETPRRFARDNGDGQESVVPAKTLLARLEKQAAQLAVVRAKRDDAQRALRQERGRMARLRHTVEEERATRERVEAQLARERAAREEAERSAEEAHVTANALGGQLQLLRAQLKSLEGQRGRWRLRRGRKHRH